MKRLLFFLLFCIGASAHGQALREINYQYQYNPAETFSFQFRPVRGATQWTVYYSLTLRDTTVSARQYTVQCDLRTSLGDKEGTPLKTTVFGVDAVSQNGEVSVTTAQDVQIVVAKVVNEVAKRAWYFYTTLDPKYPVTGGMQRGPGAFVTGEYVKLNQPYTLVAEGATRVISYYRDDFPPAGPAFSETLGRVSSRLVVDSTFTAGPQSTLTFTAPGLYLVQEDTAAAEGFAFRAEDDYPRFATLQKLGGPLIYICTKQEFDRIKLARDDKRAFDKVILGITGDTERAKKLMRSYFRRVELANQYFTSYKEGWKTDRGMIYIIFGLPDEVFRFADREVWSYKNSLYQISFDFVKSPTLFDPENYVLVREKKFTETWYEVIDLWRNGRF